MFALKLRARRAACHDEHHRHEMHCTSLCCGKSGQTLCVTNLCGDAAQAGRLREMGLREGVNVTVLRHGDPLVVRVDGVRLGLGRSAATNVLCEFLDASHGIDRAPLHA